MHSDAKPTILNVDDNFAGRYARSRVLEHEGFHVIESATGQEALQLAAGQPDLILLDVSLPDLDGFEVCRRLKQDPRTRSIPVMHLSAVAVSEHDRTSGLESGADAYLTAPIEPGLLVAAIRATLRARRAEAEAKEAARAWQTTFDAISQGVVRINETGHIRQINHWLRAVAGRPDSDLTGQPWQVLFPDAAEPEGGWPFERAASLGRHESAEIKVGQRWFQVAADPLIDEAGTFQGAILTVLEITERKQADTERERLLRQLEDERARFEAVLRQMPTGVIIAEAPSGRTLLTNERMECIFRGPYPTGGGPENYAQFQPRRPDGRPYRLEEFPLVRTIASGEVVSGEEIQFVRGDGTRATVLVSSAPVQNREGYVIAGVALLDDVTERNRLEHQVRQSQKMEAIGRVAGGVAHDFNNLLTIIGGYGQMLLDSMPKESPMRNDMEAILEASERATTLTRQLLTFSRRQIVQPRVLDLNRQVSKIGRMLRRVIGEQVHLSTSLKASPAQIRIDPAQLEQVLMNLALNARDAMPTGGKLTIRTAAIEHRADALTGPRELKPGRHVLLAIEDTGTGMDGETQSHLFEPFYTTKGKGKGTGLGLSSVYGIVKQSGGEIAVESSPGHGTRMLLYFPVADGSEGQETARAPREAVQTGTETILVVEDEPEVRRLATEMLTRQGYEVLEASSGAEALRVWQEHGGGIALVLTDVIMPQMSGPDLAAALRELCPALRVLYMSGYTDDVIAQHGIAGGRAELIHKPFTLDALSRKIRSVLDQPARKGGA